MNAPPVSASFDDIIKALTIVVLLSFVVERVLALIFEWDAWARFEKWWDEWLTARNQGPFRLKEPIAATLSIWICTYMKFDLLALIFHERSKEPHGDFLGMIVTALVVAGGSKGAIKLLQDTLGVRPPATTPQTFTQSMTQGMATQTPIPAAPTQTSVPLAMATTGITAPPEPVQVQMPSFAPAPTRNPGPPSG